MLRYLAAGRGAVAEIHPALEKLRAELAIPTDFPDDALAEAQAAAENADGRVGSWGDARDVPLVTIDPPDSRDLDQALHIERRGDGYLVHYAIADVGSVVRPKGALDAETHRRGMTTYSPDGRFGLHPPELSEGSASLLPEQDRPACLWQIALDADGQISGAGVRGAIVRSRAQLDYEGVQGALDSDHADEPLRLLRELGKLRQQREADRGGVSMDIPEQNVERDSHGYHLRFRTPLPVEGWNAQISLLTGIAGAMLMREAGVGVLRTLDQARQLDIDRLRSVARGLGLRWPGSVTYGEFVRSMDAGAPAHAAFLQEATSLFRGAGYRVFGLADGDVPAPGEWMHGAIAAEYAHVTAPLRRLVDRYGSEICLAHTAGRPAPEWVREALVDLPSTMGRTGQRASAYERGCVDLIEAAILSGREGEVFDGVVVQARPGRSEQASGERGTVVLADPAVRGPVTSAPGVELPVGERVRVRLTVADVAERRVEFSLA